MLLHLLATMKKRQVCMHGRPATPVPCQEHDLNVSIKPLQDFFGGILSISQQQISRVDGFGTDFWGWGREDDNLKLRLQNHGVCPFRMENDLGGVVGFGDEACCL